MIPATINIQIASEFKPLPTSDQCQLWANTLLNHIKRPHDTEILLRFVDAAESAKLNRRFRNKSGPTNVLSFPIDNNNYLGDIVICAPLVKQEAEQQGKPLMAHFAHLIVHGILHLLGHDHISENDARIMEGIEIAILKDLGYPNPYE